VRELNDLLETPCFRIAQHDLQGSDAPAGVQAVDAGLFDLLTRAPRCGLALAKWPPGSTLVRLERAMDVLTLGLRLLNLMFKLIPS